MSDSIYLSMQSFGSDEDVATCLTTLAAHVNNLHSSFCTKFIWVDVSNVLYLFQPLFLAGTCICNQTLKLPTLK